MKKFARIMAPITLSAAVISSIASPSAFAYDTRVDGKVPTSITLNKTAPLYNPAFVQGGFGSPIGAALSPQTVTVVGMSGILPHLSFLVDTWLGPKVVDIPDSEMTKHYDTDSFAGKTVVINKVTPLYGAPSIEVKNALALAPQAVKVGGFQGIFLSIETWVGPKWIDSRDVTLSQ